MSLNFVNVVHNKYTSWIILCCSLVLTLGAWFLSKNYAEQIAEDKFTLRTTELSFALEQRMLYYEQSLWGVTGLFNANENVNRLDWDNYIASIRLTDRLPGIQSIGFAVPLKNRNEVNAFEKEILEEGFSDFTVKPIGKRPSYSAIKFISPFDWRNKRAFGYDMYSNEVRRTAMDLAQQTGFTSTSGIITLVQETKEDVQKGFLTYVPVYKKNVSVSDKSIIGWVYAAFRANDLFENIFGEEDQFFGFNLFDEYVNQPEHLLYSTNDSYLADDIINNRFVKIMLLKVQGRNWYLQMFAKPTFTKGSESNLPTWVALSGLFVEILLFYVIYALYSLNKKAKEMAKEMTIEINNQNKALENTNFELRQFAYATTHDVKSPINSIANFLTFLKDDKDITNEMSLEAIEWIDSSCDKALNTIQSLVRIIELKEEISFETEQIDVKLFIENTLEDFKPELDNVNATFNLEINPKELIFNASYFKIILDNLVSNAIKYRSDKRELVINFASHITYDFHMLSISDNGLGVDLEKHGHKIFGLFKRAHDHVEGSGFGLYMVKNVLEKAGGRISLESTVDEGSTFNLFFKKSL